VLAASVTPGRRGVPRLYSWIEYSKARAARKLLNMGISARRLRPNIEWLEEHVPLWYTLPLIAYSETVILRPENGGPAFTVGQVRQRVEADLIESAQLASRIKDALAEMEDEGPLGVLSEYRDVVDMDPRIRAGVPIIRGTRIETELLARLTGCGGRAEDIAERFDLDAYQVKRALEFETAVAA
jgi:uncharacterized protein (DUF433 family)